MEIHYLTGNITISIMIFQLLFQCKVTSTFLFIFYSGFAVATSKPLCVRLCESIISWRKAYRMDVLSIFRGRRYSQLSKICTMLKQRSLLMVGNKHISPKTFYFTRIMSFFVLLTFRHFGCLFCIKIVSVGSPTFP